MCCGLIVFCLSSWKALVQQVKPSSSVGTQLSLSAAQEPYFALDAMKLNKEEDRELIRLYQERNNGAALEVG